MADERDESAPEDVDAAFARIVAGWDADGPDEPGATDEPGVGPRPDAPLVIPVWRGDTGSSVTDLLAGGAAEEPDDVAPDEEFTPPDPAPLPPLTDRLFWGALGGLVLGPLLLLYLSLARPGWGSWSTALAILLTVAGFVCLVVRQPAHRSDDPDRGAVV